MKVIDLFAEVESQRFAANFRILSGFRVFQLALQADATLAQLSTALAQSPQDAQAVLQRLLDLLKANEQPEYAHPYDAAIAGYLYVISRADPSLTKRAIEGVLATPQLWWARRLAQQLQEGAVAAETQQ
jgi:hypothetical protein